MAEKKEKGNRYEIVGKRLEEVYKSLDVLEHLVHKAYHDIVEEHQIHKKDFIMEDSEIEKLVDRISYALTDQLIEFGKIKSKDAVDKETLENVLLPHYFGFHKESVKKKLKSRRHITKQLIDEILQSIKNKFEISMTSAAFYGIEENIEEAKAYLKQLAEEHEPMYIENIAKAKTMEELKEYFVGLHNKKRNVDLTKKIREKYGAGPTYEVE